MVTILTRPTRNIQKFPQKVVSEMMHINVLRLFVLHEIFFSVKHFLYDLTIA